MLFRQSELFRQYIFLGLFFCDPKINAFFRIKLLVFDFFFELLRLGWRGYSDNQVVDPLDLPLSLHLAGRPVDLLEFPACL